MSPALLLRCLRGVAFLGSAFVASVPASGQDPLPGDTVPRPGAGGVRAVSIARGGPGYLVVWEDVRTSLSGVVAAAGEPLMGNQADVYAMRLGADGRPLDPAPIVIANQGRNQQRPCVAWNGQQWLVVFTSERPDWYFFHDIVGVRVDALGNVLDAAPIAIRPELASPSNYYGANPYVTSNGTDWVVVWEDWNPSNGRPNVRGTRVAPSGQVLDPNWITLHEHNAPSFGPREPRLSWAGGQYLLTWREAATATMFGRRVSTALQPLAAPFAISTTGSQYAPSLATDGAQHYLLAGDRLFRITAAGVVLDPAGIAVPLAGTGAAVPMSAAWNGSSLSIVQNQVASFGSTTGSDVWLQRFDAAGALVDPQPLRVSADVDGEYEPVVAGDQGASVVPFIAIAQDPNVHLEDVRAVHVDAAGSAAPAVAVDAGYERQQDVRVIDAPFGHLAVFLGVSSTSVRLLAQRLDAGGAPIDSEPVEVATWTRQGRWRPAVAGNGSSFLFGWTVPGVGTFVRRYDLQLAPLDAQPVTAFTGATSSPTVAEVGGDYLVAAPFPVTIDTNQLRAVRVRGSDSTVLDAAPFVVAGNFVVDFDAVGFGGRWFVHWTHAPTHDSPALSIYGAFVEPTGLVRPSLVVSTTARSLLSDCAVQGGEALVVYHSALHGEDGIRGQRVTAAGALLGGEIVICDDLVGQMFATASTFGGDYAVAWTDYRGNAGIEQLRGDLRLARVSAAGAVLDPGGVAVTATALPEDLADLSANAATVLCWSGFAASGPGHEVQRIFVQRVDDLLPTAWRIAGTGSGGTDGSPALQGFGPVSAGTSLQLALAGADAGAPCVFALGLARVDVPLLGGTLVPRPDFVVFGLADAIGRAAFSLQWPAGIAAGVRVWHQAWTIDGAAASGVASTNGLVSTSH